MSTDRVYLVSPAGVPNYGDELIARGWVSWLARHRPEAEVWLDCQQPGRVAAELAGVHPHLTVTDTLWRTMWDSSTAHGRHRERGPEDLVRNLGSPDYDIGLLHARGASTVHFLGGGHLNAVWPDHLGLIAAARVLTEFGARLVGTGLGLAPGADGLADLVDAFDHLTVRDEASAALTGAEITPDDAMLAVQTELGRNRVTEPEIVVCLQQDLRDPKAYDRQIEQAVEFIEAHRGEVARVRYVEAIPGMAGDFAGFTRLSERIDDVVLTPFTEVWIDGLPLGAQQVWLTSRFHFHLFAAQAGARGIAFTPDDEYYSTKHESARATGSNWAIVRPSDQMPALADLERPVLQGSPVAAKAAEARAIYTP